jgi:hypothetical protein
MGFLERAGTQAQAALGAPVRDIIVILPAGVFKQLAQGALIEGLASPIPYVGDAIGDVVERAADERLRQKQAKQKRTINSTSTAWNNKALLLVRTDTKLAIFDVKQGLLRNSLGVLRWACDLAAVAEVTIPGKPGLFFELTIGIAGQAPLTFRCRRKFLARIQRLQAAVQARQPARS